MQNRRLDAIGADLLTWAEVVGGRLYTGPLFVKYNGLLRGLDSPVPFFEEFDDPALLPEGCVRAIHRHRKALAECERHNAV